MHCPPRLRKLRRLSGSRGRFSTTSYDERADGWTLAHTSSQQRRGQKGGFHPLSNPRATIFQLELSSAVTFVCQRSIFINILVGFRGSIQDLKGPFQARWERFTRRTQFKHDESSMGLEGLSQACGAGSIPGPRRS